LAGDLPPGCLTSPHHDLGSTTGTHTYVVFAYKKGSGTYLTTYFNPQLFAVANKLASRHYTFEEKVPTTLSIPKYSNLMSSAPVSPIEVPC
jgi:hypothetical protein